MLLNPNKDLIVVVDMIEGFCFKGAMASSVVASIIPKMKEFLQTNLANGVKVIHYVDSHPENALEFNSYPTHCLKDSEEAQVVKDLDFAEVELISKNSTNGFFAYNPFLEKKNIYIIGCVTDICVFELALTAQKYKEEHALPYTVNVIADLVETFDAPNHDHKQINKQYLDILSQRGVKIITE